MVEIVKGVQHILATLYILYLWPKVMLSFTFAPGDQILNYLVCYFSAFGVKLGNLAIILQVFFIKCGLSSH